MIPNPMKLSWLYLNPKLPGILESASIRRMVGIYIHLLQEPIHKELRDFKWTVANHTNIHVPINRKKDQFK